jgi:hypothetical protein
VTRQHEGLSPERWASFALDRQVLMIANEMHRAGKLLGPADRDRRLAAYERVLRLTDLTIDVQRRPALRRELLRWRDLAAALYVEEDPAFEAHRSAFLALLRFTPAAFAQIAALSAA